jgi:uncharacterized protein (DUF2384 family)
MSRYRLSDHRHEFGLLVSRVLDLCGELKVKDSEVARILRLPPGSWPLSHRRVACWQPEVWQEKRLRNLREFLEHVWMVLGEDARSWLRTPNWLIFDQLPIDVIAQDLSALKQMLERLRNEVEAS